MRPRRKSITTRPESLPEPRKNRNFLIFEQLADAALREASRKTPPQRRERFKEALRKDPFMQSLLKGRPTLLNAVGLAAANR